MKSVKQELSRNPNLMAFGLWLFTILCVAIAMVFGIVSSVFSIINTVMTPIEVITGIHGLFLWNGLAGNRLNNSLLYNRLLSGNRLTIVTHE